MQQSVAVTGFKLFFKDKRGMPLIAAARDMGGSAHSVQHKIFDSQDSALEFVQALLARGGEAITLSRGSERIATGVGLERLARDR